MAAKSGTYHRNEHWNFLPEAGSACQFVLQGRVVKSLRAQTFLGAAVADTGRGFCLLVVSREWTLGSL